MAFQPNKWLVSGRLVWEEWWLEYRQFDSVYAILDPPVHFSTHTELSADKIVLLQKYFSTYSYQVSVFCLIG